jgi:bifunctional non-homologous end joining protein LigD
MPKFDFCLPTNGKAVPAGPEWFHEIKFDGYRLRVERDGNRVRLITRGGYDWTKRFPWIAEAALKNRRSQFVIDGEAVILSINGMSDFSALHSRKQNHEVQLCAFDVLAMDGEDLRELPLSKARRASIGFCADARRHLHQPIRERSNRTRSLPRRLRHGIGGLGV